MNTKDSMIQWHPAFDAALQIELSDEAEYLEFEPEHLVSKKPMQIDVLVKNNKRIKIKKNIGRIFRQYNIIEYKSPEDKLKKDRGITVREVDYGIYYLLGDNIPIQLLVIPKLSKENNYWLNNLRNNLKSGGELLQFIEEYEKNKKSKLYQELADTIMRANWKELREEQKMCEALRELFADDLRESELRGRNAGKIESIIQQTVKKYKKGCTVEETADMLEESVGMIEQIYNLLNEYAPDYNVEEIYQALQEES